MLLCPNHHHQATVGALTESEQRLRKANPFNIDRGYVDGQLFVTVPAIAIGVASVMFIGPGFKLVVDGQPLLQLEREGGGRVLVSLDLYDENNRLLFSLVRNEWVTGDPFLWDFEFGHRWLRLRKKRGEVTLHLDSRDEPITMEADLWRNVQHISCRGGSLLINRVANARPEGMEHLALVELMIVIKTNEPGVQLVPDPAFGKSFIVSDPDPKERLSQGLECLARLEREK